jgi:hypothetical protein
MDKRLELKIMTSAMKNAEMVKRFGDIPKTP